MNKFDVIFLSEAREFLFELDEKARDKIVFNTRKAKIKNDKELFKKLEGEIWEFRTKYSKTHYCLFAFEGQNKQIRNLGLGNPRDNKENRKNTQESRKD